MLFKAANTEVVLLLVVAFSGKLFSMLIKGKICQRSPGGGSGGGGGLLFKERDEKLLWRDS